MAVRKPGQGSEKRKRTARTFIRWTEAEAAALRAAAENAGLTTGAYIRLQALGEPGPRSLRKMPADAVELRKLAGQLGYVGNNLNQLTRLANIGDLERPRELDATLTNVNQAIDECMKALGRDP